MSNDTPSLYSEFLKTARVYFNKEELNIVAQDLRRWNVSKHPFFVQVSQAEEEPKLEIVFITDKNVIVDYGFQKSIKEIIMFDMDKIYNAQILETKDTTNVNIFGPGPSALTYTSNTDIYRDSLREFFFGVTNLLGN